jgi:hypothetical protein
MCIANLDGLDMHLALEAQIDAQIEVNTTFENLKIVDIFRVVEEALKQMKRLQNRRMVDGDGRNDMDDMEDMEHQGEDEDYVLTTMENIPSKKEKEEKIKRMLIEAMVIHEALTKNLFESNFKNKNNIVFLDKSSSWVKM